VIKELIITVLLVGTLALAVFYVWKDMKETKEKKKD